MRPTVLIPTLLAAALAAVYLIWAPPSTDLAAQTFRTELFEREGFTLWNNAWYAGHYTPGYSVAFPPLAALVGVRVAGALAVVAATALFSILARRRLGDRALLGSIWFAVGMSSWLLTGRFTFMLGVAVGLAALLAVDSRRLVLAGVLAALCSLASPVAGFFLAIAGAAIALAGERARGGALALCALAPIAVLSLAFPMGGEQPFTFSTFVAIPIFVVLALWLVPPEQRALRIGIAIYGLLALALFIVATPIGSNVARLGALFAGPVAALVLIRRPVVLALVAAPLLFWQLQGPVEDVAKGSGDPATERAYYAPLLAELDRLTGDGPPVRIQIPPTRNRWEATYVAPQQPLARGWLRQLESDDFDGFTDGRLTPSAYRAWLDDRAVSYVAVPDAELDYLARDEVDLVNGGLDFLEPVWSNEHWDLYRVDDARPLGVSALGADWFEVEAQRAGPIDVAINYTPYWRVVSGDACVSEGESGWTTVDARAPGTIRVEARILGDSC
jgi:hypothetical protein